LEEEMKNFVMIFVILILTVFVTATLPAAENPSVAFGKKLFNDTSLGGPSNTQTCNTCHADGKGLDKAGSRPDLAAIINKCITGALGGKPLAADSMEMQSLILYIKSFKSN
jgi:cytochrome c